MNEYCARIALLRVNALSLAVAACISRLLSKRSFLSYALTLIALAAPGMAHAGNATIRTQEKALWYIAGGAGDTVNRFDTPEAAFATVQAAYAAGCAQPGAQTRIVVSNLRPKPGASLANGSPTQYIYSESSWYCSTNEPKTVNSTGGPILLESRCPDAPNWMKVAITANTGPSDKIRWCEFFKSSPEPQACDGWVGNPIHAATGVKKQSEIDYQSPNGLLEFKRIYRSDIGNFTSVASAAGFYDYSGSVGQLGGCISEQYLRVPSLGTRSSYCFPLMSVAQPSAMLWTTDGQLIDFTLASGQATPNPNINDRAMKVVDGQGNAYWRLYRADNTVETYSSVGRLLNRTTVDGKSVAFGYSTPDTPASSAPRGGLLISQTDPFGRSLNFLYDSAARLTEMGDPAGRSYMYSYDTTSPPCSSGTCDQLSAVQYPDGFSREYLYNEAAYVTPTTNMVPPLLTGINEVFQGTTVRVGSYGYDAKRRATLTQSSNATGRYTTTFPTTTSVSITDPLNSQRTITFQSLLNTVYSTGSSQPAGSGCAASTSNQSHDANGNTTQKDDFNGYRACYAHDLSRNLETARVEGLGATVTCSAYIAANATLPTGARKTSTQWHPYWRLETKVAEPGRIVTSVYNGQPDPFNTGAVASCAPASALLPDGKPIAVLCKRVEQATTDADGRLGFSAALPAGVAARTSTWTYNQYGQVLTATDPRGKTTTSTYYTDTTADHTMGDLASVTNPLGQVTRNPKYNPHGQVLQSVDPNGVVTDYTYDLRQRLTSVKIGSHLTQYEYYPTGLLKKATQPDASWIAYTYDDAHRLTDVADSRGNSIHYTLDNAGNRLKEEAKDPSGALALQLNRVMDALSRVQQTTGRE